MPHKKFPRMSQAQLKLLIKKQTNQNLEKPMIILEPPRFIQQPPMREFVQPTKAVSPKKLAKIKVPPRTTGGTAAEKGSDKVNEMVMKGEKADSGNGAVSPKKQAKIEVPPRTTGTGAAEKGSDKVDEMVMNEEKQPPQKEKYEKEKEEYQKEMEEDQKQIPDAVKPEQTIPEPEDEYQELPGCSSSSSSSPFAPYNCEPNGEVEMPLPLPLPLPLDNFPSLESLQSSAWKFFSYPGFQPMQEVEAPSTSTTPPYMGANQADLAETLDPSYEAPPLDLSSLSLAFDTFSLTDLSQEQEQEQPRPPPPGCNIFGANISATEKLTEGQKILLQAAVTQPDIPLEDALIAIVLDLRHQRLNREAAASAASAASATYSSYPTNDMQGYPGYQDSYFSSGYQQPQDQSQQPSQAQLDYQNHYSNYQNQPENDGYFYQNQNQNQNQPENSYNYQNQLGSSYPSYDLNLQANPQSQSPMAMQADQPIMPPLAYPMQQQSDDYIIPDFIRDFWPELLMAPDFNATNGSML